MTVFPDLARYDRAGVDTETTTEEQIRLRRPVGISVSVPDDEGPGYHGWYMCWGHEGGGNNCSRGEAADWFRREFLHRPELLAVFFNAPYDLKMLVQEGILTWPTLLPNFCDAGTSAALLNEQEPSYSLERLCGKYLNKHKDDGYLVEWCAAQFGGKPWHSVQAKNFWRAPGDLVAPYAVGDSDLTLELHDRNVALIEQQGLGSVYRLETQIIPVTVNMTMAGVRIDRARAERARAGLAAELGRAKTRWAEIAEQAGFPMPPNAEWIVPSTKQSAPVFRALEIPAVGETESGNDSVVKAALEAAAEQHPAARTLLDVRELSKLQGTFIDSYILGEADEQDLVHGEFHPLPVQTEAGKRYGTVTGRFGSSLHNVPGDRHPAPGRLIRSLFVPWSPDHAWVKADYSQIEYRFLGHYAGGSIADAYNRPQPSEICRACGKDHSIVGADFHCMLTLLIDRMDICNRRRTKNVNFAKVYGAGLAKAAATAGISVELWKEVVGIYDEKVPEVAQIYRLADQRANRRGYITTWGGRRCRFPTIEEMRRRVEASGKQFRSRPGEVHAGTYRALNYLLQGSAADLMKKAMVRVASLVDWRDTFLHLTVHDEMDLSVPREQQDVFMKRLREAMEDWGPSDGPELRVPIRADIKAGDSWGALIKEDPDEEAPTASLKAAVDAANNG